MSILFIHSIEKICWMKRGQSEQDDIDLDLTELFEQKKKRFWRQPSLSLSWRACASSVYVCVFRSNDEKIENFPLKKHILSFCSTILFANWNEE